MNTEQTIHKGSFIGVNFQILLFKFKFTKYQKLLFD